MNKLFKLFVACVLAMNVLGASAQNNWREVINSLTFEAPQGALYYPKGSSANLRAQPSTKARLVDICDDGCTSIEKGEIVEDKGSNPSWVQTVVEGKTVYISKSVMDKCSNAPIPQGIANMPYWQEYRSYDEGNMGWRVGVMAGSLDMYLADVNTIYGQRYLMLGKKVGNVIVFKYRVLFDALIEEGELAPDGKYSLDVKNEDGVKTYILTANRRMIKTFTARDFGDNGGEYEERFLDLTSISAPMVYNIFRKVIEANDVHYFYLTAESFSSDLPHTPC